MKKSLGPPLKDPAIFLMRWDSDCPSFAQDDDCWGEVCSSHGVQPYLRLRIICRFAKAEPIFRCAISNLLVKSPHGWLLLWYHERVRWAQTSESAVFLLNKPNSVGIFMYSEFFISDGDILDNQHAFTLCHSSLQSTHAKFSNLIASDCTCSRKWNDGADERRAVISPRKVTSSFINLWPTCWSW